MIKTAKLPNWSSIRKDRESLCVSYFAILPSVIAEGFLIIKKLRKELLVLFPQQKYILKIT